MKMSKKTIIIGVVVLVIVLITIASIVFKGKDVQEEDVADDVKINFDDDFTVDEEELEESEVEIEPEEVVEEPVVEGEVVEEEVQPEATGEVVPQAQGQVITDPNMIGDPQESNAITADNYLQYFSDMLCYGRPIDDSAIAQDYKDDVEAVIEATGAVRRDAIPEQSSYEGRYVTLTDGVDTYRFDFAFDDEGNICSLTYTKL